MSKNPLTMESLIPVMEMGASGVMLSTVRRRYEAYRSAGKSIQQAIEATEQELGITDVQVDASGKIVVFFKEGFGLDEVWFANMADRAEAEKDWIEHHPGFSFGVFAGPQLISKHPSIPAARRAAKLLVGQGKNIRIKDINSPDRVYWHE